MSSTYRSSHYESIYRAEHSHFWFLARNRLLGTLIRRYLPSGATFFEVGFGTGGVLAYLSEIGYRMSGLDVNKKALFFAGKRCYAKLYCQSIYTFRTSKRYDAIGAFDVMEHQTDDLEFLKRCVRLLRPNGYVFLTVPSGKALWNTLDVYAGHKRRYEPRDIIQLLDGAGCRVVWWNYWNVIPLPFYLVWRAFGSTVSPDRAIGDYLRVPIAPVNMLLQGLLWIERVCMFYLRFPFGATLVFCARKK